jgi:hypothetical protein
VAERRIGSFVGRALVAALAAAIVVIAALRSWPVVVESPSPDRRRVEDLQRLSHVIAAFRAEHDILPATLARLPSIAAAPTHTTDPVSGQPYDYRPLGPLAYELCARFDAVSSDAQRDFWWHDAGRHCFALETRSRSKPAPSLPSAPVPTTSPTPETPPAADPDPGPPPPPSTTPPEGSAGGSTPPAR